MRRVMVRRMLSAGLRSSIRSGGSKPYRAGSYRPHALSTGQGTAKCSSGGGGGLGRPHEYGYREGGSAQVRALIEALQLAARSRPAATARHAITIALELFQWYS